MILRVLLLLTILVFAHAAAHDDCESKLLAERYYGAFRALLKSQKLKQPDLEKAIASETPYHPLSTASRRSELSTARTLFDQLTADPEILPHWPHIRAQLAELLREEQGRQEIRSEAKQETARVLAPHEVHNFSYGDEHELAWTKLPDGQIGIAGVRAPDGKLNELFVMTPEGHEIFRTALPTPAPDAQRWRLGWHHDMNGKLWLYVSAFGATDGNFPRSYMHRLDWSDGKFVPIEVKRNGEWYVEYFRSVGDKYMIAVITDPQYWDVSDGTVRRINLPVLNHEQSASLNEDGILFTRHFSGSTDNGRNAVFTTRDGKAWRILSQGSNVELRTARPDAAVKTMKSSIFTHQLQAAETANGRLLIAKIGHDPALRDTQLVIYAPFESEETPIFTREIEGAHAAAPYLHWLQGLNGESLLGFNSDEHVYFADPAAQTLLSFTHPAGFTGWFDDGAQTYFYTHWKNKVQIFSVFRETRR